MAYTFEQVFAADPSNPSNVAQNAAVTIFAPGDGTLSPLTITDPDGQPLANPIITNANGFGSAFAHATLDRVAWAGGGFTGFFTSYEGMKQVALDAQVAAEAAASTAGAEAAAVADAAIGDATAEAEAAAASAASAQAAASASATAAANSAALVGAPADAAIAAAANNSASATKTALNATIVAASTDTLARYTGIDATGTTVSTAGIQSALTAAAGRTLYAPQGTYLIDAPLTIPANTTLHLDDRAVIKLNPGASRKAVILNAAGATLRGGTVDGNAANQTAVSGTPLVQVAADDVTVSNVAVLGAKDYGIRVTGNRAKILNCTVIESGDNAIFVQPSTASLRDVVVDGCYVDRSGQGAAVVEGGIKVHNATTFVVTGAKITNNTVKLPTNTTLAPPVAIEVFIDCDDATITGNVVDGGRIGISISRAKGATVTGNTCTRNKDYGIEFSGAIRSTATGNTVNAGGIGLSGVSCNSAAASCVVSGNTVIGCTASSIKIEGVSTNISVVGNIIVATAQHGIEGLSSTYLTISGNTVDGSGTALKAVMLDRTFPAVVSGNTFRRFTQNGVLIYSTITQTIDKVAVIGNVFDSTNGALTSQLSGGATLGSAVRAQANAGATDILNVAGDVRQISGVGTPEGAFGGGPGSFYLRTDNGTAYIKNSGTGTTGWKLVTQAA